MSELYDILKNIQANPKLLLGGSGGTASVDEDGKIITPSLEVGGKVGIGTASPDATSALDITSASLGFLMPRMTTAERDNISSPATGLEIYNITTNEPEFYNGTTWLNTGLTATGGEDTEVQYNNNGVTAGISGIKTDGTNLDVSGRIDGAGVDGLLQLRAGANSPIGGVVQLEGGGSSTTGGKIRSIGGLGNTTGGNVENEGGESGNGKGGSVISLGGNGAVDDGSGDGGDVISTGGQGGFNSGKGGDVNLTSGQSEGATAVSGSIHIDIGDPFGGGDAGDVLLAESRGKVGIGTDAPATLLDIQAGGPAVTIRNTADFGRADIDLYGSRNAGAGNAELGTLSMFNTRSGSDEMIARIGFVNGQSGTSAGGINFLTKENADGSLSIRLSINDAGRVGVGSTPIVSALLSLASTTLGFLKPRMTAAQRDAISTPADGLAVHNLDINKPSYFDSNGWRNVGSLSSFEFEIFTASDLDVLDAGDVITIDGVFVLITLKESITSTKRFNIINGGGLTIRFSGGGIAAWNYSGVATFLTANGGRISVDSGLIIGNSSATLFDVTAAPTVSFNNTTVLFFGSYGTIRNTGLVLMDSDGFFAGNGTLQLIDNDVASINNIGLGTGTPVSGGVILVSGRKTGFFDLSTWNVTLQPGESFLRIDPYGPTLSASLTRIRVIGGELFDTTGGATGAFTAVADAAIGPQGIAVVSDAGGIASFNFTPGPVVFVGQEVTLSGYVTNTAYNGTFIVSDAGVGVFEIAEIPFGTDEASGSFSGDSITLTETATTLVDGDTLVIDTDGPTDYDGGAQVYNKQTNSFQINRTFTSTHTGSWDTAGINQKDPRVLANDNPGFIDSKAIAFGDINAHASTNSITDGTYLELAPAGMVQRPSTERFKLIIDSGRWEYTGNEPFQGLLTAEIFATKSGATANYRFSLSINSAIPNFANAPYTPMEVKTTKVGVTLLAPISLVKGDHFQIFVAGDGSSDDITVTDLLMSIQ